MTTTNSQPMVLFSDLLIAARRMTLDGPFRVQRCMADTEGWLYDLPWWSE